MGSQRGFTLIELIIVVSIMVLLFAISVPMVLNYIASRAFETDVGSMKDNVALAYNNSVQGVLGLDKDSTTNASSVPPDVDLQTDRVAWFVMIDKGANKYATGACLSGENPRNRSSCTGDSDYRLVDISASVEIDFTISGYSQDVIYVSFNPISGQAVVWPNTSAAVPLLEGQPIDVVLTSARDATQSATLKINGFGGISLQE